MCGYSFQTMSSEGIAPGFLLTNPILALSLLAGQRLLDFVSYLFGKPSNLRRTQHPSQRSMNTGERLHVDAGEFVCNVLRIFSYDHAHFILVQVLGENNEYLPKLNNKEWRANSANFLALWVEDVGTTHKLFSMIWMKPFHALPLKLICCRYIFVGSWRTDARSHMHPKSECKLYIRRVIKVWRVPCALWENYFHLFSDHPTGFSSSLSSPFLGPTQPAVNKAASEGADWPIWSEWISKRRFAGSQRVQGVDLR